MRACSRTATGTSVPQDQPTLDPPARARGLEPRSLHGRHGRQGLGRVDGTSCASTSATAADTEAPVSRPLPLRADARPAVRDARADRRTTASAPSPSPAIRSAATWRSSWPATSATRRRRSCKAVCAVSPTMDLAVCVQALERTANIAYQWNFVRRPQGADATEGGRLCPGCSRSSRCGRIWTVRQFDEAYTAPHHGFRDADRLLPSRERDASHRSDRGADADPHRRRRPLRAAVAPFHHPAVTGNPRVTTVVTPHGGHCAFVEHATGDYDGYWAEEEVVRFVTASRRRSISIRANSGPFPSSSCLK